MTKLRQPLTFADAMMDVAAVLGWAGARDVARRSDRMLRAWSEPDNDRSPPVAIALRLDAAYRLAGGEGAPFLAAYAHQLDVEVAAAKASFDGLVADAAQLAHESGEAVSAAIAVALPGAAPRETFRAIAETEQAQRAAGSLLRRLTSFLPRGAGPCAGKPGGPR